MKKVIKYGHDKMKQDVIKNSSEEKKLKTIEDGLKKIKNENQQIELQRKKNQYSNIDSGKEIVVTKNSQAENMVRNNIVVGITYEKCKYCGSVVIKQPRVNNSLYKNDFKESLFNEERLENEKYIRYVHEDSDFEIVSSKISDKEVLVQSSLKYEQKIREERCSGICVLFDTGSCTGHNCSTNRKSEPACDSYNTKVVYDNTVNADVVFQINETDRTTEKNNGINRMRGSNRIKGKCGVCEAGLCTRRYLLNREYPNLLENDGGDYRSMVGNFLMRLQENRKFDEMIREKLKLNELKMNGFVTELKQYIINMNDDYLLYQWEECTIETFLKRFPHINRRPTRIEIQILLYIFINYRNDIDLDHFSERFAISKYTINKYLKLCFDCSYSQLLNIIRNEHSKTLLRIPLFRIGEIGALVGYKSQYHYSLSFKRLEGMPPKEFRIKTVKEKSSMHAG